MIIFIYFVKNSVLCTNKNNTPINYTNMNIIVFFAVAILFSLVLCAIDKIRILMHKDKSIWIDGEDVFLEKGSEN